MSKCANTGGVGCYAVTQLYLATLSSAQVIKSEGGFVWACKNYDGAPHSLHTRHVPCIVVVTWDVLEFLTLHTERFYLSRTAVACHLT